MKRWLRFVNYFARQNYSLGLACSLSGQPAHRRRWFIQGGTLTDVWDFGFVVVTRYWRLKQEQADDL